MANSAPDLLLLFSWNKSPFKPKECSISSKFLERRSKSSSANIRGLKVTFCYQLYFFCSTSFNFIFNLSIYYRYYYLLLLPRNYSLQFLMYARQHILVGCPQNANCFNNASDTFRNTYEWREFPRNHTEEQVSLNLKPRVLAEKLIMDPK